MKKVYLVDEKLIGLKGEYCGVAYYSSMKKALNDFNDRVNSRHIDDSNITTEGKELITMIAKNGYIEIRLIAHEVK